VGVETKTISPETAPRVRRVDDAWSVKKSREAFSEVIGGIGSRHTKRDERPCAYRVGLWLRDVYVLGRSDCYESE
jgi:hypothetical protein